MMKLISILLTLFVIVGCNDQEDVVVITGQFSHTAEFEERGFTMTVYHYNDVVETMHEDFEIEVTPAQIAMNYVDAINSSSAGTIMLNFPGGYEEVYAALNKYKGREIYCAGIDYWGVTLPKGCREISNIYQALDRRAPIDRVVWLRQHTETANEPIIHSQMPFMVFTESPEVLAVAQEMMTTLDDIVFVSSVRLAESMMQNEGARWNVIGNFSVSTDEGDQYAYLLFHDVYPPTIDYVAALIQWHLLSPRPNCDPETWAGASYYVGKGGEYDDDLCPLD